MIAYTAVITVGQSDLYPYDITVTIDEPDFLSGQREALTGLTPHDALEHAAALIAERYHQPVSARHVIYDVPLHLLAGRIPDPLPAA